MRSFAKVTMLKTEDEKIETDECSTFGTDPNWKMVLVWPNVIVHIIINATALYGLYLAIFWTQRKTNLWVTAYAYLVHMGTSLGSHRLYTHKAYKAKFPVRLILVLLQAAAGQNSIYTWVRDHRQHHKFTDTDADPHNANRGFFFSHMGWLLVKKHPAVIATGKKLDLSDLKADALVMWQRKYLYPLYFMLSIVVPVAISVHYLNESLYNSFFVAYVLRYAVSLHITWMVNSTAHIYGMKPYNKNIRAVEVPNWISFVLVGEQYHNFHHSFPSDYRTSELGVKLNLSTLVIDTLSFLGLAYDLRSTSDDAIKQRILKTGDGSYSHNGNMLKKLREN